jgi:regulator of protease activity HflC (stomatin/prohibitin superfamily)
MEPTLNTQTPRLTRIAESVREGFARIGASVHPAGRGLRGAAPALLALGAAGLGAWMIASHPPVQTVAPGEVAVRTNQLTGGSAEFRDGPVWVLPALHELKAFSLRDRIYRPQQGRSAAGDAPFQSVEGLSLGVDLAVRYALDPAQVGRIARTLPADIDAQVVEPAVQGVAYKTLARYTVREIFSSKRAEIQQAIEAELKTKLAADGIVLRHVQIGKVDLPAEYRQGMDKLLAEELATEKMRYTLELKEKRVKETELEAQADKVRRETAAAAAGQEQIIAAKAQEEAMRHVLPFKQKQIEQRKLEAEALKAARLKQAEGEAQARRIEAAGEADSRRKLAEAEVERLERIGKVQSEQMARDGELVTRHPLLIQKTVADKLSDKIQVIIAPPSTGGAFVAAGLVGGGAGGVAGGNGAHVARRNSEEEGAQ